MGKIETSAAKDAQLDSSRQLLEYQQRITHILESFTDGFFEVDKKWIVTYWNKEAEKLLHMSRNQVLGKNLWEVYQEAVPLKFYTEYHRALEENISVRFEEYFEPQDLWVEVSAYPSGAGLSVYFKDITARVKTRNILELEKKKYEDLFNFSPIPQWVYDFETLAFLQVNEAAVKHYGYSKAEFLSMTIKDIRMLEDIIVLDGIMASKVKVGQYSQCTVKHRKKNGDIIIVLVEGNSVTFEGRNARLVLAIDHTEKVKAEQDLQMVLNRYNIVSKATSDAIWDWDIIAGTVQWNKGIKGIFGHSDVGFDFKWWETNVHPEDLIQVQEQFNRLIQNKQNNQVVEYRFRCSDGTYKHVLDRSFIIYDAGGEAIRSIGSMQDISERISHINAIEAQNKKLTEITWMQSHSLRAPLARTLGLTALIAMPDNTIEELKELSGMISDAVNELDIVLKDIIKKSS